VEALIGIIVCSKISSSSKEEPTKASVSNTISVKIVTLTKKFKKMTVRAFGFWGPSITVDFAQKTEESQFKK
jgi:hypothetical protein